jgi:hypothetical protein
MPNIVWNILITIVGYIISLLGGYLIINPIVIKLWKQYIPSRLQHGNLSAVVGVLDRFLFTTAFLMGRAEFIAIWLAFKLAGEWNPGKTELDRALHFIYLIGNGISVIISVGVALLIQTLWRP